MISLQDIKNIFNVLSSSKKLIIFESKKQYTEIFYEIEKIFKKKNIEYQSIITSENNENFITKEIFYLRPNIIFTLLKFCKNREILTSTPTINKKINNKLNYSFFQHSLLINSNDKHKNEMFFFDKVYSCSLDQSKYLEGIIDKRKIYPFRYYHLDNFFDSKIKNKIKRSNNILVAPTFGNNSLIHALNNNFFEKLLVNYKIIIRLHPESLKYKNDIDKIKFILSKLNNKNISLSNSSNIEDIKKCDFLITDNSGIALTYAYLKNVPPIFLIFDKNPLERIYENFSKNFLDNISLISSTEINEVIRKISLIKQDNSFYNKIQKFKEEQFQKYSMENINNLIV